MRAAVMENTEQNLHSMKNCLHLLLPNGIVKGFADGNDAKSRCEVTKLICLSAGGGACKKTQTVPKTQTLHRSLNGGGSRKSYCAATRKCFVFG